MPPHPPSGRASHALLRSAKYSDHSSAHRKPPFENPRSATAWQLVVSHAGTANTSGGWGCGRRAGLNCSDNYDVNSCMWNCVS